MVFSNPVDKIETMFQAMDRLNIKAECECFDTGIVRSIQMFEQVGMLKQPINVSLVMGVASGMPCRPEWIHLLKDELSALTQWQVIAIGREDAVWPTLRRAAELGGHVRTGLEDTFYLPNGTRATSSGQLIEELVKTVREVGREPATPAEARQILGCRAL
jgi:3-keto-5-aminohexanoate cleavage enzyme